MGRTDEVQFILECARAWRSFGARVTFEPGWQSRGNGLRGNYEGALVHHTAAASSQANPNPSRMVLIGGRSDLRGPLCNVTGPWCVEPWLHVIAAYPANHAGAAGGRSMGPLPVTSLFNPRVLGLEIDYAGTVPMVPGQYRAGLIFGRGVCEVLGRSTEYVRAHAETSVTGKWDPGYAPGRTIDMAAFRRDAAALILEDDMPLSDDDVRKVMDWPFVTLSNGRVVSFGEVLKSMDANIGRVRDQVAGLNAAVAKLAEAAAAGRDDLTAQELIDAVDEGIRRGGAAVLAAQAAAAQPAPAR